MKSKKENEKLPRKEHAFEVIKIKKKRRKSSVQQNELEKSKNKTWENEK